MYRITRFDFFSISDWRRNTQEEKKNRAGVIIQTGYDYFEFRYDDNGCRNGRKRYDADLFIKLINHNPIWIRTKEYNILPNLGMAKFVYRKIVDDFKDYNNLAFIKFYEVDDVNFEDYILDKYGNFIKLNENIVNKDIPKLAEASIEDRVHADILDLNKLDSGLLERSVSPFDYEEALKDLTATQ